METTVHVIASMSNWVGKSLISSKKWWSIGNFCIFPGANCGVRSPCSPIIVWWERACPRKPNALFLQVLWIGNHHKRQCGLLRVSIPAVWARLCNVITPQAFILRLPILKVKNAHSFLGVILELSLVNVAVHCGHTKSIDKRHPLEYMHAAIYDQRPCHTWHF